jgi:hypothetical protein
VASTNCGVGLEFAYAVAVMGTPNTFLNLSRSAMGRWSQLAGGSVTVGVAYVLIPLFLSAATQIASAQNGRFQLLERLESYLTLAVKLSTAERQRLFKGEPVTKMLEADATKEVAVFGAVWISAPIQRYVEAVENSETFERVGIRVLARYRESEPIRRSQRVHGVFRTTPRAK